VSTTALTIVNNVLARLRESQVTSVTFSPSKYAQLILRFVNETKQEMENAWTWTALRQVKTVTTAAGTPDYTVTGAGQRFKNTDKYDRIWNVTTKQWVDLFPSWLIEQYKQTVASQQRQPCYYRWIGESGGDPNLEFWPTPDAIYSISVPLYIPELDLSAYSDTFKLPALPIELGTWARAISERGEDGGKSSSDQWSLYTNSLADHIARDAVLVGDELIWES
jgi:hypothetical protein